MSISSIISICLGVLLMIVLSTLFSGWVLTVLWEWFIIPLFSRPDLDIPQLSIVAACGLMLTFRFLITQPTNNQNKSNGATDWRSKLGEVIILSFMYPAVVLLVGWIFSVFL